VHGHRVHETHDIPIHDAICHLSTVDPFVVPIVPCLIEKSRFAISQLLLLCSRTLDIPIHDDSWLPLWSFLLFKKSGFAVLNCKVHSSTRSVISRFAMTRWTTSCRDLSRWLRSVPRVLRTDGPDRLSLFRGFRYQCAYVHGIPNSVNPNSPVG
jgi:hypothetical protein